MLTRWSDWSFGDVDRTMAEIEALRREMNRLFEARPHGGRRSRAQGYPRVGLFDRGSELVVRAEVPGVADKDLDITVDQGMVTVRGHRMVDAPEGYSVHRQERAGMEFARTFTLPCHVDTEKTTANLKHGVLTLVLPKAPEAQPRQITVTTK